MAYNMNKAKTVYAIAVNSYWINCLQLKGETIKLVEEDVEYISSLERRNTYAKLLTNRLFKRTNWILLQLETLVKSTKDKIIRIPEWKTIFVYPRLAMGE